MADRGPRPVSLGVQPDAIPSELRVVPRWVGWRYQMRRGEWKKPPVCPANGQDASVGDRTTWGTFEQALAAATKHHLDGVGLVFTADDDNCAIDLDRCRNPVTGELHAWAADLVRRLDSYTEVSPSGMGVKVFVRATLPSRGRRAGGVEVYDEGRYFTVTGRHLEETPTTVQRRQQAAEELYAEVCGVALTDEQVIERAGTASNGEKFNRLWAGDTTGYDSESEADRALCGILAFWTDGEQEQIERLVSRSALGRREKWRDRADYRELTVARAVEGQAEVYRPAGLLTRVTKKKQNKQEETDFSTQVAPEGQGRGDCPLPPDVLEQGMRAALDLAQTKGELPDWKATFELARLLRQWKDYPPEAFREVVEVFCGLTGREFEGFWYTFLTAWPKVRTSKGEDVFAWAVEQAEAEPYTPLPNLGPMYARVASISWHLAQYTGSSFWLPRERLASLLKTNAMQVSRIVTLLEQYGVVKCVDHDYSYAKKKAKEYVFTGRPLTGAAA